MSLSEYQQFRLGSDKHHSRAAATRATGASKGVRQNSACCNKTSRPEAEKGNICQTLQFFSLTCVLILFMVDLLAGSSLHRAKEGHDGTGISPKSLADG